MPTLTGFYFAMYLFVMTWFFQILFQYLQKAEPKRREQFLRIHGFHLLANQVGKLEWLKSNFSFEFQYIVKHSGDKNKENHQAVNCLDG